jgi:hypothetical protein
MRRALACGLLASLAAAQDHRVLRMTSHFDAGRTEEALALATPPVFDLLCLGDEDSREVLLAMIVHNDRNASKDEACARVVDLARRARAGALRRETLETRILAAEALLVEGHVARNKRKEDWIASWLEAARELADWRGDDARRDWALVRAIQILGEGAGIRNAPAERLLAEARTLVARDKRGETPESPAFLAYRYFLAEQHARGGRAIEARAALAPFEEVAARLGGREDDLDRATLLNLAVSLSRREGFPLKAGFRTTREKAANLTVDLPVSRLWFAPIRGEADNAWIYQYAPDGRLLRRVMLWVEAGGMPLRRFAETSVGRKQAEMTEVARKSGPKSGSFNKNLRKGVLATLEGLDKYERRVTSRHFFFEGDERRGWGHYEVATHVYGERPPDDPLYDEFVASIR